MTPTGDGASGVTLSTLIASTQQRTIAQRTMKGTDRQIQEAIEIGRANKKTIELVKNWCAHVAIRRFGGEGVVEAETGLPIGMRGLDCPHAHEQGMAAMDLEAVALAFYDRNCGGCAQRQPVRLPNISEVVARRDERHARARTRAEEERDAARAATERRAAAREQLALDGDATRRSILERIDDLDVDPVPERAAVLLEIVRAVPDKFDSATQDALSALIAPGGVRARTALEALSTVAKGTDRLASAGLRMLAMDEATALAAAAVGDRLGSATIDEIKAALPAIFKLAAPLRGFGRTSDAVVEPLVSAWTASPDAVREFVGVLFRSDGKHSRILASRCAMTLVAHDAGLAADFSRLALDSIDKPDDADAPDGSASAAAAKLLGRCLTQRFDEVDTLLQAAWTTASEEQRTAIVEAYVETLKRSDEEPAHGTSTIEEKSFGRLVQVICARKLDDSFRRAADFFGYAARQHQRCVEHHAHTLLGAAALLLEDMKDRYSPLLDPRPTMLKAIEADTRRSHMRSAADSIMELVGRAGATSPETVGALIVKTLENLSDEQNSLRAALVRCLGRVGQSHGGLALVVPAIYSGMMASAQVVRAAAVSAYAEVANEAADDLPRLMHETFFLLLRDPYVIVHAAAVRALRRTRLPDDLAALAGGVVWILVDVHSDGEHEELLSDCIDALLWRPGASLTAPRRSKIATIIGRMAPHFSDQLLTTHARSLDGVPEYGDAVVRALADHETIESDSNKLLDCLRRLTRADINRLGAGIAGIAGKTHPGLGGAFNGILDVVARAGAWTICEQIAKAPLADLLDVPRDRPLRRVVNARLIAVQIEAALTVGDGPVAVRLAQNWFAAQTEIEAEHPDVRDQWTFFRAFSARVGALSLVTSVGNRSASADDIERIAREIGAVAKALGETVPGRAYAVYGRAVAALAHLVRWAHAVRAAEADADRFLRAGRQAARDVRATREQALPDATSNGIATALDRIDALVNLEEIAGVATALASIPMPLPFHDAPARPFRNQPPPGDDPADPCVVFVSFTVDGVALADPHVITPDELHDLDLTVRVTRWPTGARLILDALTVEPTPTIGELPRFALDRPNSDSPHEIKHGGRMLIRVPQAIAARPLEFVYRAYFAPDQPQLVVVVAGERRIRVRSHDPARNPVTGYRHVDLKLLEIRDQLRTFIGLRDSDVDAFLLVLASLGQMAGEALQDKMFPAKISEKEFQQKVRERLRGNPRIGSELQEHAQVAGGIMDLSFRETTIELKVEPDKLVVPQGVEGYSQQAAQYTVGNDKRLGILCVLDCSDKTVAPGSIVNDILLRPVAPPGQPGGVPLLLGIVIVRGNLRRPSELSK